MALGFLPRVTADLLLFWSQASLSLPVSFLSMSRVWEQLFPDHSGLGIALFAYLTRSP